MALCRSTSVQDQLEVQAKDDGNFDQSSGTGDHRKVIRLKIYLESKTNRICHKLKWVKRWEGVKDDAKIFDLSS